MEQQLDCALDLMRRLPPQQIERNLSDLIDLVPALCEELLSSVDQPLKIARDKNSGKDYLLCDYNRDGDSYRYSGCSLGQHLDCIPVIYLVLSFFTVSIACTYTFVCSDALPCL